MAKDKSKSNTPLADDTAYHAAMDAIKNLLSSPPMSIAEIQLQRTKKYEEVSTWISEQRKRIRFIPPQNVIAALLEYRKIDYEGALKRLGYEVDTMIEQHRRRVHNEETAIQRYVILVGSKKDDITKNADYLSMREIVERRRANPGMTDVDLKEAIDEQKQAVDRWAKAQMQQTNEAVLSWGIQGTGGLQAMHDLIKRHTAGLEVVVSSVVSLTLLYIWIFWPLLFRQSRSM